MPLARRHLRPPPAPKPCWPRPELAARLAEGRAPERLATLLVGPPGVGKTALATGYAAGFQGPVAWVTITEADVGDLVAAVCAALPGIGDHAARLLQGVPDPLLLLRHAAGLVASELEAPAPEGALLVLDGLDLLGPAALAWIDQLLAYFPPEGQLVLIARAAPALQLAALRMAGELVELKDWGLSSEASQAAFAALAPAGAEMPADAAGWLAAIAWAARTGGDLSSPRDYLRETWLGRLAPERREKLARALAGSQADLEADVPLAPDGTPHPLVRQLFDLPSAPRWLRLVALEADAPADAMVAYLAAGEPGEALRVLDDRAHDLAARGALAQLERMLDAFPEADRAAVEWQVARGELCRQRGELDEAEACFRAAEAGDATRGRALLGRAAIAGVRGGDGMGELAGQALAAVGEEPTAERATALGLLGVHALYHGDAAGWRQHLDAALAGFREVNDPLGAAKTLHNLALGHAHAGENDQAIALYGEAVAACQAAGRLAFPMTHVNRALLFAQAGERAAARADAELGLKLARERGLARDAAYARWALARLNTQEGRWSLAHGLFQEALATARQTGDTLLQADALAGVAEVTLRQGLPAGAWELVEEGAAARGLPWHDPGHYELALVGASALATLGRRVEARAGLQQLAEALADRGEAPDRRARVLAALEEGSSKQEAVRQPDPTPAEAPALAVRLFGRMDADVDGQPVAPTRWRGPRIRLLLAYLSFERAGASREQLEAAFFGGADASRAAVALMVKRLREALEPGLAKSTASRFVIFEDGRYMLDRGQAIETDLEKFRHLLSLAARAEGERAIALREEALDLYRGPLLAEFDDPWVEGLREGARRQAMEALRRVVAELVAIGRAPDALARAEACVRRERLAEEPVMAKMEALAALGRRDEARKAAADLTNRLKRELGEGASDELLALAQAIGRVR